MFLRIEWQEEYSKVGCSSISGNNVTEILTGKASAVAACQRSIMNKKKTLRNKDNLKIPPSIFFWFMMEFDNLKNIKRNIK